MRISRPMAGMLAAITLATPAITLTAQTALADDATTTTTSTSTDAPTSTTDIPADVRDLLDASTLTINGQRTDLASMIHVDGSHRYDGRDWYGLSWTGPAIPDNARLETSGRLQYAQDDWTILTLEDDKTRIDLDLTCERDGRLNRSFPRRDWKSPVTCSSRTRLAEPSSTAEPSPRATCTSCTARSTGRPRTSPPS